MHRMLTIITRRADVSDTDFRHFMRDEYGPVYQAMTQVRAYRQLFLSPLPGGRHPDQGPHAVVEIAFDSPESMREALDTDEYRAAAQRRQLFMAHIEPSILNATNVLA